MSDSEEEDLLVVVEFNHPVPPPTNEHTFKILGLDTDNPIVQYQKQVFRGDWRDCIGTKVLFTERKVPEVRDPVFSPTISKLYDVADKTGKVLELKPYVLNLKGDSMAQGESEEDEENTSAKNESAGI